MRCCGNDGSCISVCEFSQWRSERPRAAQRSPRREVDGLAATWREAREECEAQGMRLCRPEQLGACCKTGCGMDGVAVWTSASCAGSGHPVAADHEPRRAHNALAATQLLGLQPATRVRARALCREGARLGSKMDGGWSVCLDSLAPADCVVYSAGSHAEVGFDLAMARRGCSVHAFDPTMEQLGLVDGVVTEDSDALLFGANTVYKNIFNDKKYVEVRFSLFGRFCFSFLFFECTLCVIYTTITINTYTITHCIWCSNTHI